jgi:hypothetical protein
MLILLLCIAAFLGVVAYAWFRGPRIPHQPTCPLCGRYFKYCRCCTETITVPAGHNFPPLQKGLDGWDGSIEIISKPGVNPVQRSTICWIIKETDGSHTLHVSHERPHQ